MTILENWKPVPGWENAYEVSDLGQVRSMDRCVCARGGKTRTHRGRVLRPTVIKDGYLRVKLSANGRQILKTVHRLVLLAFVGPCPEGKQVCHGNGDPKDNRLSNLRYGSVTENHADRKKHGTLPMGERHGSTVFSDEVVRQVRCADGGINEIAARFGMSPTHVAALRKGKLRGNA